MIKRARLRVIIEVFKQEYSRRVSSGAFFASTLLGMILIIVLAALPSLAPTLQKSGVLAQQKMYVILTGPADVTKKATPLINRDHLLQVIATRIKKPSNITHADDLKSNNADADFHFTLSSDHKVSPHGQTLSIHITANNIRGDWRGRLRPLLPLAASYETGRTVQTEQNIIKIPYFVNNANVNGNVSAIGRNTEEALASILLGALYGAILVGSQILMGGISEEKTNRIAEMLSAMGNPRDLLWGKMIAAASLTLTQGTIWIVGGGATYLFTSRAIIETVAKKAAATHATPAVSVLPPASETLTLLAVFIVLAPMIYLQFAAIYAGSAALVSRPEETSMLSAPLSLPVAGSVLSGVWASQHPDSLLTNIGSFIPLIGGFTTTAKIGTGMIDYHTIVFIILAQTIYTLVFLEAAARIYRVGLTLYGKFPSPKQVFIMLQKA